VSVVSHGQGALVSLLLADLARHCRTAIRVVLTLNVPEALALERDAFPFAIETVSNARPRGFGANHNAALRDAHTPYVCILNPDIRLRADPFPRLIEELRLPSVGVAAPLILGPGGGVEDSARRFPTLATLARKSFRRDHSLDYAIGGAPLSPDWVAGMFLVLRTGVFAEVHGFDEGYFLYYEDVDLCRRLRRRGYDVRLVPAVSAIHEARRDSRRKLRYLRWHLASIARYFLTR
jgi:N-acetylglucosaminyl-diphospho-decaprenol L-rhamnosyltransferase